VTVAEDEIIAEDLTVAGANVKIAGELKKGLNAFGANLDISGSVDGDVNAFGASIVLSGQYHKKVKAGAANLVLDGIFEDTVEAGAAKITVTPAAVIKGQLNYTSAILDQQEGSRVLGKVVRKDMDFRGDEVEKWERKGKKVSRAAKIIFWFLSLAALLIVGLIVNAFFPKQTDTIVALISESPWRNIGVGFIFLVAVPAAIIIAFITVVGIPAGIIAGFLYGFILYVSRIYIGVWIGRKIIGYFKKTQIGAFVWPLLLGLVTIALIGLIPYLGWLFKLSCLLISLGALWLALWRAIQSK
jgi:cytoskeletal protein CcmA (bactofilin family)